MDTRSEYIRIPNVICNDKDLTINSKYLYGWIWNEIYFGEFYQSIEDICNILNCSETTARKSLKQLKVKGYIKIEIIKGNTRKITPMVNDSMILTEKKQVEAYRTRKEIEEYNKNNPINETPEFVKEYIRNLK